jgi:hypothetical protein
MNSFDVPGIPKMPDIRFDEENEFGGKFNWREIERFLLVNNPVAHRACAISIYRNMDEKEHAHLLIAMLAKQNQDQFEALLKIKMTESQTYSVPPKMFFKTPLWKKIFYLLLSGNWID